MVKEKRILSYFIGWLILGLFICFVGITKTNALVIDGKFQGQSVNTNIGINANNYIQNNSYIMVDESNALNYYVAEICTTNNVFSISNVSSQSGNISYAKSITNIKSCNTTNYTGTLAKVYFKINQWADAGNGNFGVIFNFRLNSNVSYYTDIRVINIYTTNEIDETSELLNNQTNELNNSINNSTNTITGSIGDAENNINSNINDMEQSIVDSNKETQDVIKDQFISCNQGENILNNITWINGSYINSDNNIIDSQSWRHTDYIDISNYDGNYIYKNDILGSSPKTILYDESKNVIQVLNVNNTTTYNLQKYNAKYIRISTTLVGKPKLYVEEICSNRLDEQNETSKGILGKIGDLISYINPASENFFVYKLIDLLLDLLKKLFIPEDGYFELWFNDLKIFFEDKLGFLATPFTIIIDFVNRYLDLNPSEDIIINIPDITVPNFEEHIIVKATSFNWSQLLKSKDSLNTLWQLYLSFVDVFLILNFINLCENKYNRIFGGDTTQYEYYTVEDSYNVDVNTGEIKSQRRNERTTTRKKVN